MTTTAKSMTSREFRFASEAAYARYRAAKKAAKTDAEREATDAAFDAERAEFRKMTIADTSQARPRPSKACEFEQSECDECTAGRPQKCHRM